MNGHEALAFVRAVVEAVRTHAGGRAQATRSKACAVQLQAPRRLASASCITTNLVPNLLHSGCTRMRTSTGDPQQSMRSTALGTATSCISAIYIYIYISIYKQQRLNSALYSLRRGNVLHLHAAARWTSTSAARWTSAAAPRATRLNALTAP